MYLPNNGAMITFTYYINFLQNSQWGVTFVPMSGLIPLRKLQFFNLKCI